MLNVFAAQLRKAKVYQLKILQKRQMRTNKDRLTAAIPERNSFVFV